MLLQNIQYKQTLNLLTAEISCYRFTEYYTPTNALIVYHLLV